MAATGLAQALPALLRSPRPLNQVARRCQAMPVQALEGAADPEHGGRFANPPSTAHAQGLSTGSGNTTRNLKLDLDRGRQIEPRPHGHQQPSPFPAPSILVGGPTGRAPRHAGSACSAGSSPPPSSPGSSPLAGGPGPVGRNGIRLFHLGDRARAADLCLPDQSPHPTNRLVAPLYPLASGAACRTRATLAAPAPCLSPRARQLGTTCQHADAAIAAWATKAGVTEPTLWIALVGRGWSCWPASSPSCAPHKEDAGGGSPRPVLALACLPPVWISVRYYFHPQDSWPWASPLAALACAMRRTLGRRRRPRRLRGAHHNLRCSSRCRSLCWRPQDGQPHSLPHRRRRRRRCCVVAPLWPPQLRAPPGAPSPSAQGTTLQGGTLIWEIDHHHAAGRGRRLTGPADHAGASAISVVGLPPARP